MSPEEKGICRRYDAIMRFLSKEEHEELLKAVVSEHRYLKRIQELKVRNSALLFICTFFLMKLNVGLYIEAQ